MVQVDVSIAADTEPLSLASDLAPPQATISRLPTELLLEIFSRLVESNLIRSSDRRAPSDWSPKQLAFTQVCHSWRHIALADPSLWTCIPTNHSPSWSKKFIDRSRSLPISLRIWTGDLYYESLAPIIEQKSRIEKLSLVRASRAYESDPGVFEHILDRLHHLSMPSLRALEICGFADIRSLPNLLSDRFLGGVATPYLTKLSLQYCGISSSSLLFQGNLTELFLSHIVIWSSVADILDSLRRLPNLQDLTIESVLPPPSSPDVAPEVSHLYLPFLQNLTLGDNHVSFKFAIILLEHLSFHCLESFELSVASGRPPEKGFQWQNPLVFRALKLQSCTLSPLSSLLQPSLLHLELLSTTIWDSITGLLETLRHLPNLRKLILVSPVGMHPVPDSVPQPQTVALPDLEWIILDDRGFQGPVSWIPSLISYLTIPRTAKVSLTCDINETHISIMVQMVSDLFLPARMAGLRLSNVDMAVGDGAHLLSLGAHMCFPTLFAPNASHVNMTLANSEIKQTIEVAFRNHARHPFEFSKSGMEQLSSRLFTGCIPAIRSVNMKCFLPVHLYLFDPMVLVFICLTLLEEITVVGDSFLPLAEALVSATTNAPFAATFPRLRHVTCEGISFCYLSVKATQCIHAGLKALNATESDRVIRVSLRQCRVTENFVRRLRECLPVDALDWDGVTNVYDPRTW